MRELKQSTIHNTKLKNFIKNVKGKGKAGPEGSRRLRLPDFMTIGT
jgi:hypothetical protein